MEAGLHQERKDSGCKVGTEEMVGSPEKEYKEQVLDLILELTLKKPTSGRNSGHLVTGPSQVHWELEKVEFKTRVRAG